MAARFDIVTGRTVMGGHVFARGQVWRQKTSGALFVVTMTDPQGLAAHLRRVGAGPDDHELRRDFDTIVYSSTHYEEVPSC